MGTEYQLKPSTHVTRHVGLDLLNIFAMIAVVGYHACMYTGILNTTDRAAVNYIFTVILKCICSVAVNCFWLISGYFLSRRTDFRSKPILSLWGWVLFYSWSALIILTVIGQLPEQSRLLSYLFPITRGQYWFISIYIELMLFMPFITKSLNVINQRSHLTILLILFTTQSFLPVVGARQFDPGSYSFGWALTLYLTGAYIERYLSASSHSCGRALLGLVGSYAALFAALAVNLYCKSKWQVRPFACENYNFPLVAATAIALILFFRSLPLKLPPLAVSCIAQLRPAILGVYLIHEIPAVRQHVWKMVAADGFQSPQFIVRLLVAILLVFVSCLILHKSLQTVVSSGTSILCCLRKGRNKHDA